MLHLRYYLKRNEIDTDMPLDQWGRGMPPCAIRRASPLYSARALQQVRWNLGAMSAAVLSLAAVAPVRARRGVYNGPTASTTAPWRHGCLRWAQLRPKVSASVANDAHCYLPRRTERV